MLVGSYVGYRKFAAPGAQPEPNSAANPQVPQPPPAPPAAPPASAATIPGASQPIEEQQRQLIDRAHALADAKDYKAAQALAEEAKKLSGPLQAQAEELRQRANLEAARGAELLQSSREEKLLWDEATKAMDAGRLDDAEILFRKILILPEAPHHRAEAEKLVDQTIPARREQEQLWAQAQKLSESQEVGHLAASLKVLDQLLALGGPHTAEAQQKRDFVFQQFARANAKKNNLPPPKFPRAERGNFDELETQFAQAVQQANAQALQQLEQLRQKFLAIVSAGGPLQGDARDYANILIPKTQKIIEERLAYAETGAAANAEYEKALKDYEPGGRDTKFKRVAFPCAPPISAHRGIEQPSRAGGQAVRHRGDSGGAKTSKPLTRPVTPTPTATWPINLVPSEALRWFCLQANRSGGTSASAIRNRGRKMKRQRIFLIPASGLAALIAVFVFGMHHSVRAAANSSSASLQAVATAGTPQKVIFDTDFVVPPQDDGMALLLAVKSPELQILGITTVAGNDTMQRATSDALQSSKFATAPTSRCTAERTARSSTKKPSGTPRSTESGGPTKRRPPLPADSPRSRPKKKAPWTS